MASFSSSKVKWRALRARAIFEFTDCLRRFLLALRRAPVDGRPASQALHHRMEGRNNLVRQRRTLIRAFGSKRDIVFVCALKKNPIQLVQKSVGLLQHKRVFPASPPGFRPFSFFFLWLATTCKTDWRTFRRFPPRPLPLSPAQATRPPQQHDDGSYAHFVDSD